MAGANIPGMVFVALACQLFTFTNRRTRETGALYRENCKSVDIR